ncbi:MAG: FAD binding domain-containing protein [Nitrososphaerota archaeon]|nr:FAD binding domain-containing protein [Nitrososphaerota archaeon]
MRNELAKFGYLQPTSVSDAVGMLTKYGDKAKVIAGGTDLLYRMKDHVTYHTPQYLVDISGLGLDQITFSQSDGLKIGATATLSRVKDNPDVQQNFGAIAQSLTGHPVQITNMATAAGDISQEVWCWYLRNNYDCWRNGGTVCYAANGDNRYYHSIFGGNLCYAVHAGDLTPALFALNADVTIAGPGGSRTASMDQFMPGVSIVDGRVKENTLRYNEFITQIHVPTPAAGTKSAFFRVTDRNAIDFPFASVAVAATFNGSSVASARVVLGHVATKPIGATAAESYLAGKTLTEDVFAAAADQALQGATPLTHPSVGAHGTQQGTPGNAFRVYVAKGAVINALRLLNS